MASGKEKTPVVLDAQSLPIPGIRPLDRSQQKSKPGIDWGIEAVASAGLRSLQAPPPEPILRALMEDE